MITLHDNGNIPCCDCKRDTGLHFADFVFNPNEVYCHSCSAALLSEIEDDEPIEEEPPTLRMAAPYPFPFMDLVDPSHIYD